MPIRPFPYRTLLDWYQENGRHDLPWRTDQSPYRVWLSEILLQQTQAPRVVPFFNRIVAAYPTVADLAKASFEEFFPYYDGLGYYSRARNLLATAKEVSNRFDGTFPSSTEELVSLPGVGPYTAEAVRAFAFGIPTLPFDTNLEKVFSRYFFGTKFRKLTKDEKRRIGEDFLSSGESGRDVAAALMDFANTVSTNALSKIDWNSYPFPECEFFRTRGALETGRTKPRAAFPMADATLVAILADERGSKLFSQEPGGTYAPFAMPPPLGRDPRSVIKAFFSESGLSVSVRPPYSKGFLDGAPFAFFRVRVQTGAPVGTPFPKHAFDAWWSRVSRGKTADFDRTPAKMSDGYGFTF